MSTKSPNETGDIDAGGFSSWLAKMVEAKQKNATSDVPCGDCNACCRASQFVQIEASERKALARIPKQLLFAAPGLEDGTLIMGYDEKGHCPMLKNNACSIYSVRPKTCRTYDCRLFAGAGIVIPGKEKRGVRQQVERWRFQYPTEKDALEHKAMRAAAAHARHEKAGGPGSPPIHPTRLALRALDTYQDFMPSDAPDSDGSK